MAAAPLLQALLDAHPDLPRSGDPATLYPLALARAEEGLRRSGFDEAELAVYQALSREMEERLAAAGGADRRPRFFVVIPVAERPRQLRGCLESLLELCRRYGYGGLRDGRYAKVTALIADDGRDPADRRANRELAAHFTAQGLETRHLDHDRQRERVAELDGAAAGIVGSAAGEFGHKGPSRMRNIAYLELARLARAGGEPQRCRFLFIDSDQEFRIRVDGPQGTRDLYGLHYFHHLERIFAENQGVAVLTGKVVGDPPVSPAVMAGTFLRDVNAFLGRIAAADPEAPCGFHDLHALGRGRAGDAAYHDLAELFGFRQGGEPFPYTCPLPEGHDHRAAFTRFCAGLAGFFDGEHPTRQSVFDPGEPPETVQPARTIYTGNYLLGYAALRYYIPFAGLRLRMAGPVLGRLIRAELGPGFVSANLPLLHRRTVEETGRAEFRPGVAHDGGHSDLSGEFERQYFGDVMLFTVERLGERGYPAVTPAEAEIAALLAAVEGEMRDRYHATRERIVAGLAELHGHLHLPRWWHRASGLQDAVAQLATFHANLEHNFGPGARGYALIHDPGHRARRLAAMAAALAGYDAERREWEALLEQG